MVTCHTRRKVAVVQAGTSGIGLAIARRLLIDGYFVIVSSRREANVCQAVSSLKSSGADVSGVVGHAGREEDRILLANAAISARADGLVHALVCNAATSISYGSLVSTNAKEWAKMMDTNVTATMATVAQFVRCRAFAPGASVVLVSSIGAYTPLPALGAYSVTKTALLGLCKALATELAPDVRVNCVAPGIIRTKFSERLWRPWEDAESTHEAASHALHSEALTTVAGDSEQAGISEGLTRTGALIGKKLPIVVPLQRLGTPADVSGVVSFLISDDAAYVTGETIIVAGGMHSRL